MAVKEPLRIADGIYSVEGGVDGGKAPHLLSRNQIAWAENVTLRGGSPNPRPGFSQINLIGDANTPTGTSESLRFQGIDFYEDTAGKGYFIAHAGGRTFRIDINLAKALVSEISIPGDPQNDLSPIVYGCQADRYLVIQDGSNRPLIYDGANTRRAGSDEVPVGTGPMAYGMGRLWVARGREYVAGDIVGGETGVLKFTENDYLNEGGSFTVPLRSGGISAMTFTASPNTALGQGELLVATPDTVFSTVLPTTRDQWKNLTDPVQRIVVINNGSLSQYSTTLVNGDVYMRARDGIRSVIQAVRDFSQSGNVPISRELSRALIGDNPQLLRFSSSILFDNRLLTTVGAVRKTNGAYFNSIAVLDFDLISSIGSRLPPAWDGVWSGYRFLRLTKGRFNGEERAFAVLENPSKGSVKQVIVKTPINNQSVGSGTVSAPPAGGTTATIQARYRVTSAVVTALSGGTGYTLGDIVTMVGPGTPTAEAMFMVTGVTLGVVTSISMIAGRGGDYGVTVNPISSYTTTGGTGTGLEVTVQSTMDKIIVMDGGSGYDTIPVISFPSQPTLKAFAVIENNWELWEITKSAKFDYYLNSDLEKTESRFKCSIETPSFNFMNNQGVLVRDQKKLVAAEVWMDKISGVVDCSISYKPNQFPIWQLWHSWGFSTLYKDCGVSTDCEPKTYVDQSRSRIGIPTPPENCDLTTNTNLRIGREFQAKIEWTGYATVKMIEIVCYIVPEDTHPECVPATEGTTGMTNTCVTYVTEVVGGGGDIDCLTDENGGVLTP